jgi:hypothetical protein
MPIKKSVRLVDETIATCRKLSPTPDINWSGSINNMSAQFNLFIADNTPELSEKEWTAIFWTYNSHSPHPDPLIEVNLLSWNLTEGYQYDEQVRILLNTEEKATALIEKVKDWTTSQRLAAIYHAKAFWRDPNANFPVPLKCAHTPYHRFTPPDWCNGMTHRLAYALVIHGEFKSKSQLLAAVKTQPEDYFIKLPNFGNVCLTELKEWSES